MINERRSFIKTSVALAGGAVVSTLPFAGAFATGSDAIKIALNWLRKPRHRSSISGLKY